MKHTGPGKSAKPRSLKPFGSKRDHQHASDIAVKIEAITADRKLTPKERREYMSAVKHSGKDKKGIAEARKWLFDK